MLEARTVISKKDSGAFQESVTLDFDQRYKRRCLMKTDEGHYFLLNLAHPITLNHGDVLELSNGILVQVKAADEELLDIQSDDPTLLIHLAWSLGNMHRALEIRPSCLRIQYDYVIENEFKAHNIKLIRHKAPFSPTTVAHDHSHE